jgi:hypothetical protein
VRMATRRPHLVVLTEVHVDDRADGRRVPKWRDRVDRETTTLRPLPGARSPSPRAVARWCL